MLQSIRDLRGYRLFAADGEIGTVEDFYFDDVRWKIQYLVVKTGGWLFGRQVLISPVFAGPADANARRIPVALTAEQVKSSPDIDTHKPVSRQHSQDSFPYPGWPAYGFVAEGIPATVTDPLPIEHTGDPHLRSANEVCGYQVSATDGGVGSTEDFVFDEASWEIQFIIVDTGTWLDRRPVLIAPQWISNISWAERRVVVDLHSEAIRTSPRFHPVFPIAPEYAVQIHDHYGKKIPERTADAVRVQLSRRETKSLYDKISKVYDLLSERSEEPVRQAALAQLAAQPGETILEIGFGTGHCLVVLANAVGPLGKVHAIDLSDGMLDEAKALIRKEGVADRVDARRGDAIALPYDSETIDGVFMSFTLELFDEHEIPAVLQECWRVMKAGGRIVIAGMSKRGEHGFIFEAYEWTHRHFPNFVDCRPILVREAVEAAGFTVTATEVMRIWVPVEVVLAVK